MRTVFYQFYWAGKQDPKGSSQCWHLSHLVENIKKSNHVCLNPHSKIKYAERFTKEKRKVWNFTILELLLSSKPQFIQYLTITVTGHCHCFCMWTLLWLTTEGFKRVIYLWGIYFSYEYLEIHYSNEKAFKADVQYRSLYSSAFIRCYKMSFKKYKKVIKSYICIYLVI